MLLEVVVLLRVLLWLVVRCSPSVGCGGRLWGYLAAEVLAGGAWPEGRGIPQILGSVIDRVVLIVWLLLLLAVDVM